MNKLIFTALLSLMVLVSCNKNNDCDPETITSKWIPGKEISVDYNMEFERNDYSVVDGDRRLFEYHHSGAQCDNVYDDEWGEKLSFIIDAETADFEFTDQDIMQTHCFYQEYGAWVRHNQYEINEGIIKGEKISKNEWRIEVSVTTTPLFDDEQPKIIAFTGIFKEE